MCVFKNCVYVGRQRYAVIWPYTVCRRNTITKTSRTHTDTHTHERIFLKDVSIRNSLRSNKNTTHRFPSPAIARLGVYIYDMKAVYGLQDVFSGVYIHARTTQAAHHIASKAASIQPIEIVRTQPGVRNVTCRSPQSPGTRFVQVLGT